MDKRSSTKTVSCWSKRSKLERCLITLITLTTITILFLTGNIFVKLSSSGKNQPNEICMTQECIQTAANILDKIDFNVDPCEDFYKFSCGKFIRKSHIPDDRLSLSAFSIIRDRLNLQLREILETPIKPQESKSFQLIKTFYRSCMNTTQIEQNGLREIKKIIRETGGWPVLEGRTWSENSFDWKKLIYRFKKNGIINISFFDIYINIDKMNSTKHNLTISQPSIDFLRQLTANGLNDSVIQAYYNFVVDVAVIFGADKKEALIDMKEMIEFLIKFAKIIKPIEENRNSSLKFNPITIRELQQNFSMIPWLQYINVMLSPTDRLSNDNTVIITFPDYFIKLGDLLQKTNKRILANYLYTKAILKLIDYLPEELNRKKLTFMNIAYGKLEDQVRWKKCLSATQILHVAKAAIFVRNFLKHNYKHDVIELIINIKSALHEIIRKSTWMDSKTKKHALEKVQTIESFIGHPMELLDNKIIDDYYKNLELNGKYYLQMYFNISLFYLTKTVEKLQETVNKTDWRRYANSNAMNAFYYRQQNSIELPAGILDEFFFNPKLPQYMNYGSIGNIIGHELTHGFDDKGRQYDKNGNLVHWWQQLSYDQFKRKTQCIIDQYNNFTIPELNLKLNGTLSQSENIADNGGVKIAYAGYRKWMQHHQPEAMLPGLPYNPKQMFWIAAATNRCTKYRPGFLKQVVLTSWHSPSYFRVTIPFMNSGNFAKDFNCPLGSRMNPKYKCGIW